MESAVTGIERRLANLQPYQAGENGIIRKRDRVAAIFAKLKAEFDPDDTLSGFDLDRLQLAAKHYEVAASTHDPDKSVRSAGCAERLLKKVKRPAAKRPTLKELGLR
jgi:hypothetical protein